MSTDEDEEEEWVNEEVSSSDDSLPLQGNEESKSFDELTDDETWEITRRDLPMTNAAAIGAMDHAYTVLNERLAAKGDSIDAGIFKNSLPRFLNSEICLGRRIASGSFAEIFVMRSWSECKSVKACPPELLSAASIIKKLVPPEDLVIKVLRPTTLVNPNLFATAAADILFEATLLATLDHPHIVKIFGRSVQSAEGFASGKRDAFFVVLERLDCNLLDRLSQWREQASDFRSAVITQGIREGRLHRIRSLLERIQAMKQLADAMVYLHERYIVHRDLKLPNVAVARNGTIKLIDFGLARILPPHNTEKDTFRMTPNTGSIRYMAPEIARGDEYNLKVDVYSFAILLYEVLNLDKAWAGCSSNDIRFKVLMRKQRPQPSMFWPSGLRDLLKMTWSDNQRARLSMTHVCSVLEKQGKLLQAEIDASVDGVEGGVEPPTI